MAQDKSKLTGFTIDLVRSPSGERVPTTPGDNNTPFCIAILGDFSGRAGNKSLPVATNKHRVIAVDRDNFELVMRRFNIRLDLALGNSIDDTVQLNIQELDDFHPDHLVQSVDIFSKLRNLRQRLLNRATFQAAASEIQGWLVPHAEPDVKKNPANKSAARSGADTVMTEGLLDSILDASQNDVLQLGGASGSDLADSLIKQAVTPYAIAGPDPRQDEWVTAVDKAIAAQLRAILHHPDFQSLEAAWRAVDSLTRRLETGTQLRLYLVDISKEELRSELNVNDLSQSQVYKLLCDSVTTTIPWSVLIGNFTFNANTEDTEFLAKLGIIAQQCNAPFVAAAHPHWIHCDSLGDTADSDEWSLPLDASILEAWRQLRQAPLAEYLGLVIPRFILRAPYGKKTSPIESFKFEEMPEPHCHECYLWGNGAFVLGYLLASSFAHQGWRMRPGEINQLDKLPLHYYEEDGENVVKPCAEIFLTERAIQKILQQGLIPLCSVRGSDSVRSSSFNSLSQSQGTLRGRWNPR